ncbi:ATP-binding cassette, subfamily F, member 3, partial [Lecanoromycetidae sp. Uapishka_2]
MEAEIRAQIPGIDHVISEYASGYLNHASTLYTLESDVSGQSPLDEAAETITALLVSASGDFSEQNSTSIHNLVDKFISKLNAANGVDPERRQMAPKTRKLAQAIQVGSQRNMSSTLGLAGGSVDLESANTRKITGDDTPALQAVLDADVWRKHLLAEQELSALEAGRSSLADTSKDAETLDREREGLDITLSDIHSKLSEMESDKAESRAASILAGLGFSEERQHYATKTFSGGWRMRLALARALFCEPDLLLLDEPSNMLDVPSITFLSTYLQSYPSTLLVVSHDRAFLNEVATDIIHQHSERLDYYKGADFDQFYATKEERRKTAKREYENQMAQRAHLQAFIDKFRYNAAKSSEAQSRIKKLEKMPVLEAPESEYTVHFKFPEVEKLSPPIIQMTDVSFGYTPDKPLLSHIDLDVQLDSRIGIVGPNGAGKTTVLKLLIGQLTPLKGLISQNPRLRVGFFAQHHVDALDMNDSAVGFMAKNYHGKQDEEYRRHLGAFGITGTTGLQKMSLLSGGQKSRVAFACLSLTNPHILVLDEPSNHLDIEAMDALSLALRNFQGGVLMVSHDVTMLQNVCTQLWVCDAGRVEKFDGDVKAYKRRITAQAANSTSGVVSAQK